MHAKHYRDVIEESVGGEAVNTTIRWLIAEKDGAPNFYMRLFAVGPGGRTPHHTHDWEHEIFILEGEGKLIGESIEHTLGPGVFAFVPGGEIHHLENTGEAVMKFLCLVPKQ